MKKIEKIYFLFFAFYKALFIIEAILRFFSKKHYQINFFYFIKLNNWWKVLNKLKKWLIKLNLVVQNLYYLVHTNIHKKILDIFCNYFHLIKLFIKFIYLINWIKIKNFGKVILYYNIKNKNMIFILYINIDKFRKIINILSN